MQSCFRTPIPSLAASCRYLLVLAAFALIASPAMAKSAGCTAVPTVFPLGGTLPAGASQSINTFATGEVLTITVNAASTPVTVTQGDGVTIASFSAPGIYLTTPITTAGRSKVTVQNGAGSVALYAVCNAPSNFTVTVTSDPATGTASNCTAGSSTDASCSLRDAVAAVNALSGAAGTIYFAPAVNAPIILTHGNLELVSNTVANITGPGANLLSISGSNASNILQVDTGATTAISGLTFTAGNASITTQENGGAISNSGSTAVSACAFIGNQAALNGGAIYSNPNSGPLTVTSSTFSGNSASNSGGAIFAQASAVTINNSTLTGNTAPIGGAINIPISATLNMTNTTIVANQSTGIGGGVRIPSGNNLVLANTVITGNSSNTNYADLYGSVTTDNGGNYYSANASGTSTLNPSLLPLANYGGPVQTMLPAPLSPLLCQGTAANATAAGLILDERNDPRTTVYGSTTCVDIGAAQSNYALSFVQQPTNTYPGVTIAPAPTVQWIESSVALAASAQPITVALTNGTLIGTPTQSTNASGFATYPGLFTASVQTNDTLKATLALSTSPVINVTATSSKFNVAVPVTSFAISGLPTNVTAGSPFSFTITALNGTSTSSYYTGTITLSSAQDPLVAFAGGSVMYTFTALDAGVHTFTLANGAVFKTAGSDTLTITDTGFNVASTSAAVTVNPAAPALLSAVTGSGQSAAIGGTFTTPLKAKVTDIYGNANSGVAVTFAGPATGTGLSPASSTVSTGIDGTASLNAIANGTASAAPYAVAATVSGIATPATFTLTNAQAASRISIVQVAPQPVNAGTGTNVPTIFVATLSDATPNSAGSPGGTVQFYMGTTPLGAPVAIVNAQATLTATFPTAGTFSITAQYLGDSNFTGSVSSALVEVVSIPSFTVNFSPSSLTITGGGNATTTLVITPVGNYQGTVTYACSGLAQFSSCIFQPALVALTGNNSVQSIPLTLYTLGPVNTSSLRSHNGGTLDAGIFWLSGLALAALIALRRRRLGRLPGLFALLLLVGTIGGLSGCATQHYYTTLGTDNITVTVTGTGTAGSGSSNVIQTTTISLIVK